MEKFSQIDTWIFDLDNTLYPHECDLFAQIDVLMTGYVAELTGMNRVDARKLQKDLYRDFGTTLRGLMETRHIDPHDFLNVVHDIDYSPLPHMPHLGEKISRLPGRKLIYTNGSVEHAQNTLDAMGIDAALFDTIFDIVASDFEPKPHSEPFKKFMAEHNVNGNQSAMFEDLPRNLEPAKVHGMTTVLVTPGTADARSAEAWEFAENDAAHIDYRTKDLVGFIDIILAK